VAKGILDDVLEGYGIDKEKLDKMDIDVAEGGYLPMPNVGEEVLVKFVRDPIKVESEKIKEKTGQDATFFARVKRVTQSEGGFKESLAEYDMVMSSSLSINLASSLRKHDVYNESLVGKVVLITKNRVQRKGMEQEMYKATYKPEITNALKGVVEEVEGEVTL
jgi:hypothetical protein